MDSQRNANEDCFGKILSDRAPESGCNFRAFDTSQGTAPPAPPAILLGTSWYPEYWPESRWEADLALMQQAGVSVVRLGEFAWSRIGAG